MPTFFFDGVQFLCEFLKLKVTIPWLKDKKMKNYIKYNVFYLMASKVVTNSFFSRSFCTFVRGNFECSYYLRGVLTISYKHDWKLSQRLARPKTSPRHETSVITMFLGFWARRKKITLATYFRTSECRILQIREHEKSMAPCNWAWHIRLTFLRNAPITVKPSDLSAALATLPYLVL